MTLRLDIRIEGAVAEITFHNPPLNHATVPLLAAIADALAELDDQPDVRAVVLASEGKAFCAGAELTRADGFDSASSDPIRAFYDQAIRIFASRKPIVAAIQGAAVGAGLGLAVAADFRIAAPEARFAGNFVKLGFHPGFALTFTLPRLIGLQRANGMLLTGDRIKADAALDYGLVDRVVEASRLREEARAFAASIAVNAPLALLATRATLRAGLIDAVRAALAHEHAEQLKLQATADYAEGVRAVNERRQGHFVGA